MTFSAGIALTRAQFAAAWTVENGSITKTAQFWNNTTYRLDVQPDGNGDVTLSLAATRGSCPSTTEVCGTNNQKLSNSVAATITQAEPLTARITDVPETHDGSTFTFDMQFSKQIEPSASHFAILWNVRNGSITNALRFADDSTKWRLTVKPKGGGDVRVSLPATTGSCPSTTEVCGVGNEKLSNSVSATVIEEVSTLTGQFSSLPTSHGNNRFRIRVRFSEAIAISYRNFDDAWDGHRRPRHRRAKSREGERSLGARRATGQREHGHADAAGRHELHEDHHLHRVRRHADDDVERQRQSMMLRPHSPKRRIATDGLTASAATTHHRGPRLGSQRGSSEPGAETR